MKLIIEILKCAILFILCMIFFDSCYKSSSVSPEKITSVRFAVVNKEVNYYGKYWWNTNSKHSLTAICPQLTALTKEIQKSTSSYDEVKLLCLDMTKWKDMQEFMYSWESTQQYSLFDTTLWTPDRDDWDNIMLTLKSYTGAYYEYVGEVGLKIDGTMATGSISLNPGLNYFCYALRKDGKTIYYGETHSKIQENGENVVYISILSGFYNN